MAQITLQPTADDVRAFAVKRGIPVKDKGRLSFRAIEAYNKGRKVQYVPTWDQPLPVLTIHGKKSDKAGRVISATYRVTAPELREWARDNGFPNLNDRGRLPQAVMDAYGTREVRKARKARKVAA